MLKLTQTRKHTHPDLKMRYFVNIHFGIKQINKTTETESRHKRREMKGNILTLSYTANC